MEGKFNVKRMPIRIGGTIYLPIAPDLIEYLGIECDGDDKPTTELSMMPDVSKHGRYIGIWSQAQQDKVKDSKSD